MGEQWPKERRLPDPLIEAGDTVELAGLRFRVSETGPGESHVDTLWWLDERGTDAYGAVVRFTPVAERVPDAAHR